MCCAVCVFYTPSYCVYGMDQDFQVYQKRHKGACLCVSAYTGKKVVFLKALPVRRILLPTHFKATSA